MARANNTRNTRAGGGARKTQEFSIAAPGAAKVQLVGDFTEWQRKPVLMEEDAHGVWRTTIKLTPGIHSYRFIVDGQWRDDPECSQFAPNPYGGQDAVRQVA